MTTTTCLDVFARCVEAVNGGELIESASARDKEFHFQDWFQKRLESLNLFFDLRSNRLTADKVPNPNAGASHRFAAYRLKTQANKQVSMADVAKGTNGVEV